MNAEEAKAYSEARTPASKAEDDPSRIIDHGGDEVDVVPDRALSAADPNAFADAIMTERFFRTHDACAKVAAGENAVRDAVDKADLEAKAARSRQLDPYR
jgi:hypothetical protein